MGFVRCTQCLQTNLLWLRAFVGMACRASFLTDIDFAPGITIPLMVIG
jgi:hypothetical protein